MQASGVGAKARLAGEAPAFGVVAKNIEDIQLFVPRRFQEFPAFEHVDAARPAARAPTRERHRGIAVVTEVDQGGAGGGVGLDAGLGRIGRLEEDVDHGEAGT
jgi:hypothetical protein